MRIPKIGKIGKISKIRASVVLVVAALALAAPAVLAQSPQNPPSLQTAQAPPQTPAVAAKPAAPVDPATAAKALTGTWKINTNFSSDLATSDATTDSSASSVKVAGSPGGAPVPTPAGGGSGTGYGSDPNGGSHSGKTMGGGSGSSSGFGRTSGKGGGFAGPTGPSEDARKAQAITDLMLEPPTQLAIAATATQVSITDDRDNVVTFNVTPKPEKVDLLVAKVDCQTKWDGATLTQEFTSGKLKLTQTYVLTVTGAQLVVTSTLTSSDAQAQTRPPVKTVYDRAVGEPRAQ